MRKQIFNKAKPVAGIFIGGLEGIGAEVALFRGIRNGRPTYFLGAPGRRTGILPRENLSSSVPTVQNLWNQQSTITGRCQESADAVGPPRGTLTVTDARLKSFRAHRFVITA
jgi:hypothetical protein